MLSLYVSPEISTPSYCHSVFARELENVLGVSAVPPGQPVAHQGPHVFFVLARWLFENLEWFKRLRGIKVVVEHDAYQNAIPDSPYYRAWTRMYRQAPYDLIAASGRETMHRLCEEGLPAAWVPKGYPADWRDVEMAAGAAIVSFGSWHASNLSGIPPIYRNRVIMDRLLRAAFEPSQVSPIRGALDSFSDTVRKYAAACMNDASMAEPMAKHFECSGLGCVPLRDAQPELLSLGYRHGESMLNYETWDELLDIVCHFLKYPEELAPLRSRTREVARRQTWRDRALRIKNLLADLEAQR